jgi:hypothetical protein
LGDAFAFLDRCAHFERADLSDGQAAFTFYDICVKGFFHDLYVRNVLGENVVNDGFYYYRVGYCPFTVEDGFAAARTLLLPGHQPTPESKLVWNSDLPSEVKRSASRWDANTLYTTVDFRLLKHFHDTGVPQVIHSKDEFYKPL